jgi:hypothetical protein
MTDQSLCDGCTEVGDVNLSSVKIEYHDNNDVQLSCFQEGSHNFRISEGSPIIVYLHQSSHSEICLKYESCFSALKIETKSFLKNKISRRGCKSSKKL